MSEQTNSYDTKINLSQTLHQVDENEKLSITNEDQTNITPNHNTTRQKIQTAINNILTAKTHSLSNTSLNKLKIHQRK